MSSRIVVLGSCGAWPEPGRACRGFLLEHDGFRLVLDLGYATVPRLLAELGSTAARGLDAAVLTHRHADHMIDLHGLFRARVLGGVASPPLPVYAADGIRERLGALEDDETAALDEALAWHPLPAQAYDVGPIPLESWALPHHVPDAGVRLGTDAGNDREASRAAAREVYDGEVLLAEEGLEVTLP